MPGFADRVEKPLVGHPECTGFIYPETPEHPGTPYQGHQHRENDPKDSSVRQRFHEALEPIGRAAPHYSRILQSRHSVLLSARSLCAACVEANRVTNSNGSELFRHATLQPTRTRVQEQERIHARK